MRPRPTQAAQSLALDQAVRLALEGWSTTPGTPPVVPARKEGGARRGRRVLVSGSSLRDLIAVVVPARKERGARRGRRVLVSGSSLRDFIAVVVLEGRGVVCSLGRGTLDPVAFRDWLISLVPEPGIDGAALARDVAAYSELCVDWHLCLDDSLPEECALLEDVYTAVEAVDHWRSLIDDDHVGARRKILGPEFRGSVDAAVQKIRSIRAELAAPRLPTHRSPDMSRTLFLDAMAGRLRREYPVRVAPQCCDVNAGACEGTRAVQLNDGDGRREAIVHIGFCQNCDLPRVIVYKRTAYLLQSLAGGRLDGLRIPTYWSAYTEHIPTPGPRRES